MLQKILKDFIGRTRANWPLYVRDCVSMDRGLKLGEHWTCRGRMSDPIWMKNEELKDKI